MPNSSPLQEIICCMGLPASGNPSQFVLERAANAAEVDVRCLTVDVEAGRLEQAISGADAMGFRGLILADALGREAFKLVAPENAATESLAAVDIIYRDSGRLVGAHSLMRVIRNLLEATTVQHKRGLILGTGVAAQAAACALAAAELEDIQFVSTGESADSWQPLCQRLTSESVNVEIAALKTQHDLVDMCDGCIIVDAAEETTWRPKGFDPLQLPETVTLIQANADPHTNLVTATSEMKARMTSALDTLSMRYEVAFEALTGTEADRSLIREALEEFFLI